MDTITKLEKYSRLDTNEVDAAAILRIQLSSYAVKEIKIRNKKKWLKICIPQSCHLNQYGVL
jgi:hypothetical protein